MQRRGDCPYPGPGHSQVPGIPGPWSSPGPGYLRAPGTPRTGGSPRAALVISGSRVSRVSSGPGYTRVRLFTESGLGHIRLPGIPGLLFTPRLETGTKREARPLFYIFNVFTFDIDFADFGGSRRPRRVKLTYPPVGHCVPHRLERQFALPGPSGAPKSMK